MWRALVVLSLTSFACFGTSKPPTGQPLRPAESSARRVVPSDLRQLARAVEEIPSGYDDPTHGKIVAALSLLARTLRVHDEETARRIEELATTLMRSPPHERVHANHARAAIGAALESFEKRMSLQPDPALRDSYVAARRAHARISDDQSLRFQIHNVAAAMRSLTNVAALTRGLPRMFAPPEDDVRIGYEAGELQRRSIRVSGLVSELAAEREWEAAGAKAAEALHGFADLLEVSPLTLAPARWRGVVSAVRYEALRLERETAISLDRSDHVKAGLVAALNALTALAPGHGSDVVAHLTHTARTATDRIDRHSTFVFQRGVIQEAFRTASDAFLVLSDARGRTTSSARLDARR